MTIQISQIPTDDATTWTGTSNIKDELIATNHTPILPIVAKQTADISTFFKVKFICRIYKDNVADEDLICILKQRPNNFTTTTNTACIFDIRGVVNSILKYTYQDYSASGGDASQDESIHDIGSNNDDYLYSQNAGNVRLIYARINWEYSTTEAGAPVEQTGASDIAQIGARYCQATFSLWSNDMNANLLDDDYMINGTSSKVLSDIPSIVETRHFVKDTSGDTLEGYISYIDKYNDKNTFLFANRYTGWGSKGDYIVIQYYEADGTYLGDMWAIKNDTPQGGAQPSASSSASQYLMYVGIGTYNLNNYNGGAYLGGVFEATFTGQPTNQIGGTGWAYYRVYFADNDDGTTRKSDYYYFVKDSQELITNSQLNCKGERVVRLAWINSLGGWDYFNFKGGQIQTLTTERHNYQSILGSPTLDEGAKYYYNSWEGGDKVFSLKSRKKSTLHTQFIQEKEALFLENMFNSPSVMVIAEGTEGKSQRVIVKKTDMERKTKARNKIEIKYTFEIAYSNDQNVNI